MRSRLAKRWYASIGVNQLVSIRAKTGSFVLDSIRRMRKGLGVVTDPSLPSTAALRKEHP